MVGGSEGDLAEGNQNQEQEEIYHCGSQFVVL